MRMLLLPTLPAVCRLARSAALAVPFAAATALVPTQAPRASDEPSPPPALDAPAVAERYVLPITPPLDQGDSGLCWVFAALSMLETDYMGSHPGADVALSRAVLQREAVADRFRRVLRGEPEKLDEGGLAVEALDLIQEFGLLDQRDFHEVVDVDPVFVAIDQRIQSEDDTVAKLHALNEELDARLGPVPKTTRLDGKTLTPSQMAAAMLGQRQWVEYDRAYAGERGWGAPHDPDARVDTRVLFVGLDQMIAAIHESLKRGEAAVGGTDDHAFLIYGADYDRAGKPLAYLIKDSLAPYAYRLDADGLHAKLHDVTVSLKGAVGSASAAGASRAAAENGEAP